MIRSGFLMVRLAERGKKSTGTSNKKIRVVVLSSGNFVSMVSVSSDFRYDIFGKV
jgi:hypothetical protein